MRSCGVLCPIASLPGNYGIGSMSRYAYELVDKLAMAGQSYWQILPLVPTGYGDSPYQSVSTYAGNTYLIDLDDLVNMGLLTKKDLAKYDYGSTDGYIDYKAIYTSRRSLLRLAYENASKIKDDEFKLFKRENREWLDDYANYMAIKELNGGESLISWEDSIRLRTRKGMRNYFKRCKGEAEYHKYMQYLFFKQWTALKRYANKKGIRIIGDLPIYVASDSADVWANPKLFMLDKKGIPSSVAGCPPDGFSEDGQLWGNPIYNWKYHKKTGYRWWISRIKHSFKLYDVLRIDHFRGFDEYYSIDYGREDARIGRWIKGPGIDIFNVINKKLGKLDIIAEDLGFMTPSVLQLLEDTGFPGMKVLQFAFDSKEESDYLPHNYNKNAIVYTGTHDNDTLKGWYTKLSDSDKKFADIYLNSNGKDTDEICWDYIRLAFGSVADTCIIPIQDYLTLGSDARINTPATLGNNWRWRLEEGMLTEPILRKMLSYADTYKRINPIYKERKRKYDIKSKKSILSKEENE